MNRFPVFYFSVEQLEKELELHRVHWVLDFMRDTASDMANECRNRITYYDRLVCDKLKTCKIQTAISKNLNVHELHVTRHKIACKLYELFKACRKLRLEDKEIVYANYNATKIEYEI